MGTKVYLADLRHDFGGVLSTDCMPLSVGYMKAVMDRDLPEVDVYICYESDFLDADVESALSGNYVTLGL